MFDDPSAEFHLPDDKKFVINGLLDESVVFCNSSNDDFTPRTYQAQLIDCSKNSNQIIFLPIERDKLRISGCLMNYFICGNDKYLRIDTYFLHISSRRWYSTFHRDL